MFALRRAAARAVFTQPIRQLSTLRPAHSRISTFQLEKPSVYRSFHQSLRWCAEEEEKKSGSPAEASGETVTTEPSAEEQRHVKEESVAAPEVVESGSQSTFGNAAEKAQDVAASAAQTVQDAASQVFQSSGRRENSDAKPSKIVYVGNLFFEVTTPQLEAEFSRFGDVAKSRVVTDNRGLSKGFGYIEFATQAAADQAVQEQNQRVFQGRRMSVQYHVRREPRNNRPPREAGQPSKTLFIGNMSYQMSDRDLNDLFREIRNVLDVRVAIDRRSGQPRGFAHADFIDVQSAERAKEYLEKKVVYGRQLKVDFSQGSSERRS